MATMKQNKASVKKGDVTVKRFYRMGEVADLTGLEPHVLRFWESEFAVLNPKKNRSGHRSYTRSDIDTILTIKRLVHEEGFTIAGAQKKLGEGGGNEKQPEPDTLRMQAREEIAAIREILENVMNMLDHPPSF